MCDGGIYLGIWLEIYRDRLGEDQRGINSSLWKTARFGILGFFETGGLHVLRDGILR